MGVREGWIHTLAPASWVTLPHTILFFVQVSNYLMAYYFFVYRKLFFDTQFYLFTTFTHYMVC